jgi:hypothetical protein
MSPRWALLASAIAVASACSSPVTATTTTTSQETVTTLPATSTTSVASNASPCIPGEPRAGIDLATDALIRHYNDRGTEQLVALIGDGRVRDPSLEPGTDVVYPSVAAWLAAADAVGDQLSTNGYGFYEPFELLVVRRNPTLENVGIEELNVTLHLWVNQDCELRVDSAPDVISSPDPCRYADLYQDEDAPEGCRGPFDPRAAHVAVWTGSEVLIYGGTSGTHESPPLDTGLRFDPSERLWRDLPPSPERLSWWPTLHAVWAEDRMMVAGRLIRGDDVAVVLLAYSPERNVWSVSPPLPGDRTAVGGVVWTGTEVILAGGDNHYPDSTAWAYDPANEQWRQLPDPPIPDVEGIEGVWTGTEAIFFGGYAEPPQSPGAAYNPATDTWRLLAVHPGTWIEGHRMIWTGREVIVYSGHIGPEHQQRLLLYNPASDTWAESSPSPIPPSERLGGAWTGDQLIMWGGYATYGTHDEGGDAVYGSGAAYDPATDTWTALPLAPLADRCDHTVTWTGSELMIFGGMTSCGLPNILADGNAAIYDPATHSWQISRP